ncbi:MAG: MFS transporter [Saprospiraceae bacterium]
MSREHLFRASCFALLVTSMTFAIRAGMLETLGKQFGLTTQALGWIAGAAFWGFPLAVIVGGWLCDIIGMKKLMVVASLTHLLGILLTIYSTGFWSLYISTLLIGIANGTVEAVCNPLIATLYPENKTTKLNHFHFWFPGGIVIGGLIVFFFNKLGWSWQLQMATMLVPLAIYTWLFMKEKFPVTERLASGISQSEMYKSLGSPLFLFMILCMFGTAITELGTNQWIDLLLKNVTDNPILILVYISGIMALGRSLAGNIVHTISPSGVLFVSAILSAVGLALLSSVSGTMVFVAAGIFAIGVCYFWPTMLGFVSENIPQSGALGLALIGAAGMFATSIFFPIMGKMYDQQLVNLLPSGADLALYKNAAANTKEAVDFAKVQLQAGPYILRNMAIIPSILILAFGGLHFFYGKNLR